MVILKGRWLRKNQLKVTQELREMETAHTHTLGIRWDHHPAQLMAQLIVHMHGNSDPMHKHEWETVGEL
jgi:hypothetical protein